MRFYRQYLEFGIQDEMKAGASRKVLRGYLELADRETKFLWQQELAHLRTRIPAKTPAPANLVHASKDVCLPELVNKALSLGL